MKIPSFILGVAAAACAMGVALTPRAAATISDDDFNALKDGQQPGPTDDQLEELHEQDQQTHQQDQQTIQQLQQQLGETQTLATNADRKPTAAKC